MSQNLQALMSEGLTHHRAGRLPQAEAAYRQIISLDPNHAEALHHLGLVALAVGNLTVAEQLVTRSIELKPEQASFHNNLGEIHRNLKRFEQAVNCYRRAVQLRPDYPDAFYNLGIGLFQLGRIEEALAAYRRALELQPAHANALNNMGNALLKLGRTAEALQCYQRAVEVNPRTPEPYRNMGMVLQQVGRLDEAENAYRQALDKRPDFAEAMDSLASVLLLKDRAEDAAALCRRAVALKPDLAEAHDHLGTALMRQMKSEEAAACYQRAVELRPNFGEAWYNLARTCQELHWHDHAAHAYRQCTQFLGHLPAPWNNLANVLKDQARLDEAMANFAKAFELDPTLHVAASNRLYTSLYHSEMEGQPSFDLHVDWARRHADPITARARPHDNDRDPERRLRIGFVSPDLRVHPLGILLEPILAAHSHERFEIVCYSDVRKPDALTERIRGGVDLWRDTAALSDEEVAALIRRDKVDVLIDLSLHMAHNRMMLFARKPAPVQMSYLAYPATSGMKAIDYVITDVHLDPPGLTEAIHVERLARLPETYWVYAPHDAPPEVTPSPAAEDGRIRFCSLNNFCKVNPRVLKVWAELLRRLPESTLTMLIHGEPERQPSVMKWLVENGLPADRTVLLPTRKRELYLKLYQEMDIGLDPFPCNGHTTTLDALYMGVPVVSLTGKTAFSRAGVSILGNMQLTELLARDTEHYLDIAEALARDIPRLVDLRASLRPRMQQSVLCDAPRLARHLEALYREAWVDYCQRPAEPVAVETPKHRLSICITVKNRSRRTLSDGAELRMLPRCVQSIVDSLPADVQAELVVADFRSDDWPLRDWLPELAANVKVKIVDVDGPFSRGGGRNIAAQHATGDILFFCDADMLVSPETLRQGVDLAEKGFAFFPVCTMLDPAGREGARSYTGFGNFFIHRDAYVMTGGWPAFGSWGGEDNLMWERCNRLMAVAREPVKGFCHQWHPDDWRHESTEQPGLQAYQQTVEQERSAHAAAIALLPGGLRVAAIADTAAAASPGFLAKLPHILIACPQPDPMPEVPAEQSHRAVDIADAWRRLERCRFALRKLAADHTFIVEPAADPLAGDLTALARRCVFAMEALGVDAVVLAGLPEAAGVEVIAWPDLRHRLLRVDAITSAADAASPLAFIVNRRGAERLLEYSFDGRSLARLLLEELDALVVASAVG